MSESVYTTVLVVSLLAVLMIAVSLVPIGIVTAIAGGRIITKTRYWLTWAWWPWLITAGVVFVLVMWGLAILVLVNLVRADVLSGDVGEWLPTVAGRGLLALVLAFLAGVGWGPAVFAQRRRKIALRTLERRLPDVKVQEDVEHARKRAADWSTARRLHVRIDPRSGTILGRKEPGRLRTWGQSWPVSRTLGASTVGRMWRKLRQPIRVPFNRAGEWVFGMVQRPTVRTWRERFADQSQVRDWTAKNPRFLKWPTDPSAWRVLLLAESGAGKTVLLWLWVICAVMTKAPIVLIDGKGIVADAERLAGMLRKLGRTVEIGGRWNLFTGPGPQITEKIMRVVGDSTGEARYYSDEVRDLLGLIQEHKPLRSMADFETRMLNLPDWLDPVALNDFSIEVSRGGPTKAERAAARIRSQMRNLLPYLAEDGWTFEDLGADVRLVPVRPAIEAERVWGDVMLADLRQWLGALERPRRMLCVVDEFAQLVSKNTDPGDLAASLAETGRSLGVGMILAAQSLAGISGDPTFRERLSSSGIAIVVGRSKNPEGAIALAGTVKRMEASGDAAEGVQLNSGRAQDAYAIPPQDVREAWDGAFWLVQGGRFTPFRAIPPEVLTVRIDEDDPAPGVGAQTAANGAQAAADGSGGASEWVGLEVQLVESAGGQWTATAWPATSEYVDDEADDPVRVTFTTAATAPSVPVGEWWDSWRPGADVRWGNKQHDLPAEWVAACNEAVGTARTRYGL